MRIPGVKTAKLFSKWLQGRLFGGALILGYHRITGTNDDDYDICVTPAHFREHLEILQQKTHPIHLSDFVLHLERGTLPRKSVVVTFDDGYVDNVRIAKPLLEQYQIPATVFVSTDYLGKEFWWDELKRLVMSTHTLPDSFVITIKGEAINWRAGQPGGAPDRIILMKLLYFHLLPLGKEEREDAMNQIRQWTGNQGKCADDHRPLTPVELLELAEGGLIAIGSHSVTHPILSNITTAQQRVEIGQSKDFLENLLGKPVSGFSYPNGKFSAETQAIVQEAGYSFACSSQKELARNHQQRFALPRLWPKDWDGEKFANYIRLWQGS